MTATADLPLPPELALDDEPLSDEQLTVLDRDDEPVPHEHPVAHWRIDDDGQAEWAMRKLRAAFDELGRLERQAEDWADRIRRWFDKSATPLRRRAAYFEGLLEEYALRLRAADPKHTRVLVPSGVVGTTRPTKGVVELADEAAVTAWLESDPDRAEALKVTKKVLISEVRKLVVIAESGDVVDASGEVVPGLAVKPPETSAKVTPGG